MIRAGEVYILFFLFFPVVMALEDDSSRSSGCVCETDGWWTVENIMQCQMVSDFLIALAYFSIPLELMYFLSCSNVFPFRWVVVQFGAFIVLCGLTHFVNIWTYSPPHSFNVMLALTVFKLLTALVSCATAITLVTLIPELLKVKVRELFLKNKARELDREVDFVKRKEETNWHVHMLTQEIRSSLDLHTILNITLVSLAKTLNLENCTIWMPLMDGSAMELTHELKRRHFQVPLTVSITDPDIEKVKTSKTAVLLDSDSQLGRASNHHWSLAGPVAGIRVPLLKSANFKGENVEHVETSYAILVLVLPCDGERQWTSQELDIVEVVADQVAVALSHAAVLEESQKMKAPLIDRNKALHQAKQDVLRANQARHFFQLAINREMRGPLYAITGLSSILQSSNLNTEQQNIASMLVKSSNLLSSLINDMMNFSESEDSALVLQLHPFHLHVMLRDAILFAQHISRTKGLSLNFEIEDGIPEHVIGDEKRILRVFLYLIGHAINLTKQGNIAIHICVEDRAEGFWHPIKRHWTPSFSDGFIYLRFEIKTTGFGGNLSDIPNLIKDLQQEKGNSVSLIAEGLGHAICKKFVQLMHGNMWIDRNSEGEGLVVTFIVRLQLVSSIEARHGMNSDEKIHGSLLQGLNVLVADENRISRTITKRLLQELGCQTTGVDTGYRCLTTLLQSGSSFQVVFIEVSMPQMDGYEVTFHIRQKCRSRSRPLVVALTASTDKQTLDRCHQLGMDGVIQKPVSLREMAVELLRIIKTCSLHS